MNIDQVYVPVQKELERFEHLFTTTLHSDVPLVEQVLGYISLLKGKRLRPLLVFLTAKMLGEPNESSIKAALIVELFHTATLVHDDVVDHSNLRRGEPTVNSIWSNKISVLVGDYLFSRTLSAMVDLRNHNSLEILAETANRITQGELLQIERDCDFNMSESVYFQLASNKTGSLFAASCQLGALSVNAKDEVVNSIGKFGEHLGIAFQIKDDLLDYTGTQHKLGKPAGNDIRENKITLPLIYALRKAEDGLRQKIVKNLEDGVDDQSTQKIIEFVNTHGGLDQSYQVAKKYSEKAFNYLNGYENSLAKSCLEALVDFTVTREK